MTGSTSAGHGYPASRLRFHPFCILQPQCADVGPAWPTLPALTRHSPDGRTIYIATDPGGLAESMKGGSTGKMQDPGAILAFTYVGEGGAGAAARPTEVTQNKAPAATGAVTAGSPPQFTAA